MVTRADRAPLPSPDSTRPWPRDRWGRLLPAAPRRGMRVERWGKALAYHRHRVTHADADRFRVAEGSAVRELPLSAWPDWLASLFDDPGAWVTVHLVGCQLSTCRGCDGSGVGRPAPVHPVPPPQNGDPVPDIPVLQRDARLMRAARVVLQEYRFEPLGPGRLRVTGPHSRYEVDISPDWSAPPRCSCPDNRRDTTAGYCKHVIAAMLRDDALRCQLLELFL